MATAKLIPGKPTVTIEGLSYEAAQAIKAWIWTSLQGRGEVRNELDSLITTKAFIEVRVPDSLQVLGLSFAEVEPYTDLHTVVDDPDDDLPF